MNKRTTNKYAELLYILTISRCTFCNGTSVFIFADIPKADLPCRICDETGIRVDSNASSLLQALIEVNNN